MSVCGGIVFIVNCVEGHSSLWTIWFIPWKVVPDCIRKLDMGLCESQQTVFLHLFCHKLLLVFLPWLPSVTDCDPEAAVESCLLLSCSRSVSYPSNRNEARTSLCSAHRTVNSIMTSSYLFIFCPYSLRYPLYLCTCGVCTCMCMQIFGPLGVLNWEDVGCLLLSPLLLEAGSFSEQRDFHFG